MAELWVFALLCALSVVLFVQGDFLMIVLLWVASYVVARWWA